VHAVPDAYALVYQVAAVNAVRGLLLNEREDDPQVGSVVLECNVDGTNTVTICDMAGTPIGGYTL